MRIIVAVTAALLMAGCSITAKEPRDELVARNAQLMAENALKDRIAEEMATQRLERFRMEQLLGLGNFGQQCGQSGPCQPATIQPMPQQYPVIQPMPQPQQPIIIAPPAPSNPPVLIQPMPQQPPVSIQPMPQPAPPVGINPPNQYCVWSCGKDAMECGWHCTAVAPPVSFLPEPTGDGSEEILYPRFHENKG